MSFVACLQRLYDDDDTCIATTLNLLMVTVFFYSFDSHNAEQPVVHGLDCLRRGDFFFFFFNNFIAEKIKIYLLSDGLMWHNKLRS